jgi:hypothetical protein
MAGKIRGATARRKAHGTSDATPGGGATAACAAVALMARIAAFAAASLLYSHPARRCRSSVVEHSLGKGEVVSSILTGSTRYSRKPMTLSWIIRSSKCSP